MSSRLGADFMAVGFGLEEASASNAVIRDWTPAATSCVAICCTFLSLPRGRRASLMSVRRGSGLLRTARTKGQFEALIQLSLPYFGSGATARDYAGLPGTDKREALSCSPCSRLPSLRCPVMATDLYAVAGGCLHAAVLPGRRSPLNADFCLIPMGLAEPSVRR